MNRKHWVTRNSERVDHRAPQRHRVACRVLAGLVVMMLSGCTSIFSPLSGIPAHRLPPQFLTPPKNNLIPIDISRLRQPPPEQHLLDARDILGIYIEGVLGNEDEAPPVHFPDQQVDLPPSIGFPIPVREDGTVSLPLVPAIDVRGKTVRQVEDLIRKAYIIDRQILQPGKDRIIVTLMRVRTVTVIVVREDARDTGDRSGTRGSRGGGIRQVDGGNQSKVIELPIYQNDVLHAMAETGGLPGLEAKNEVKILRGRLADAQKRDAFVQQFYAQQTMDPCMCPPPLPDDPSIIRIPLRLPPGEVPTFDPRDVILEDGDIVSIESRDREVFYTGGLLPGGEWALPRDYDLDVLGAMSIAGSGVSSPGSIGGIGGGGGGGGLARGIGGVPPGHLFILRRTPCNGQIVIKVDLAKALEDVRSRPFIQPGDTLILRYKPLEEVFNFGLGSFFTFGIRELFRN